MFTLEAIKTIHSKVKTGADFPTYVQEMKILGVISYDHYVSDGHTHYYGTGNFTISGGAKYPALEVASTSSRNKLQQALKIHQEGQTDYPTFCKQATDAGVEKWVVNILNLTCTYYEKAGHEMLVEEIPVPQ